MILRILLHAEAVSVALTDPTWGTTVDAAAYAREADRTELFALTEDHLKLVNRMYVDFDDGGYDGAPAVNLKRPYGNSSVFYDIAEILGIKPADDDDWRLDKDPRYETVVRLHGESALALQICLCTMSFRPGVYVKESRYDSRSWRYVRPLDVETEAAPAGSVFVGNGDWPFEAGVNETVITDPEGTCLVVDNDTLRAYGTGTTAGSGRDITPEMVRAYIADVLA